MTHEREPGLISGMDTSALITQLIQAEAAPQTALKTRLTDHPDRRVGLPHGQHHVRRRPRRRRGR